MASPTVIIETSSGPVQGFIDTHLLSDKSTAGLPPSTEVPVQKYLGIPFGQAERWRQAVPAQSWSSTLKCLEFGPACPQPPGFLSAQLKRVSPGFYGREHIGVSESEMFTVNVFTTAGVKAGDQVPVMVWIYGGSWKDGAASGLVYDPTNIIRQADRPMIVVSLNYRVNIFGFFAAEELIDDDGLVGNYGLRDQRLGLQWVQQNIEKFGGDIGNVTIFGESAGGASVCYHLGGKDALFRRVISQSAGASTMGYQTVATHQKLWNMLLSHFEIDATDPDRVAKARAIPTVELIKFVIANPSLQWAACVETGQSAIWDVHPDVRIAKGDFVGSVDSLMLGCTQDEGSIFAEAFGMTKSQQAVDKFLGAFGEATPHLKAYYVGIDDISSYEGKLTAHPVSKFLHDALFDGPVRFLAEIASSTPHAKTGKSMRVHLYKTEAIVPAWATFNWGAHHFSEVPFVFNSSSIWDNDDACAEAKTAHNFVKKWTSFASSGNPGQDWPQYTVKDRQRLVLQNDGQQHIEPVSQGTSELGLQIFSRIIRARWNIGDNRDDSTSAKM